MGREEIGRWGTKRGNEGRRENKTNTDQVLNIWKLLHTCSYLVLTTNLCGYYHPIFFKEVAKVYNN